MRLNRPEGFAARRWQKPARSQQGSEANDQLFSDFAEMVMQKKVNEEGEFFINFFEKCNLACSFCYQKHDDWTGLDQIEDKAEKLLERASALGNRYLGYQINMMGGELFMDEVPDLAFKQYYNFVEQVALGLKAQGKYAKFHFVTNLIFTKTERVVQLLDQLEFAGFEVPICISYDFAGRFSAQNIELFKENTEKFFTRTKMVSVVLTKQNIEILLGRRPENVASVAYLRSLYERGLYCLFDYFSPQHNAHAFSPSDQEMFDAMAYLMDSWPRSGPVADMFDRGPQKMSCREDQIVQPDGQVGRCRILVDKRTLEDFETGPDNFANGNMQGKFIEKKGCLQCEYFSRCGMGCFLLHDYGGRIELEECLFRKLYKKADELTESPVFGG